MGERGRPRGFDREAALERAMELFWRKTYDGTSVADLTAAMGIGAPSLYAAFGSKESLFREAVDRYTRTRGSGIWEALEENADIHAAIARFLLATADAYTAPGVPPGCLVVLGAQHEVDGASAAHEDLRRRRRDNLRTLADRFARAVREGALPPAFPVEAAAAYYLSVQNGMSLLARDGADRATLRAVARAAMFGWDRWMAGDAAG
jgi:AcrR family transcriptional regulator